jgi:hypothetical protein
MSPHLWEVSEDVVLAGSVTVDYVLVVVDQRTTGTVPVARKLYGVRPDGTPEMPDDLTLAEARDVLARIAPSIAQGDTATREARAEGYRRGYDVATSRAESRAAPDDGDGYAAAPTPAEEEG